MLETTTKCALAKSLVSNNRKLTHLLDQYCQKAWFAYHDLFLNQETEVLPRCGHDGLKGREKVIILKVDKPSVFQSEVEVSVIVRRIKGKCTYNVNLRSLKIYEEFQNVIYT